LPQLVIACVGVAPLDARFAVAEPAAVIVFRIGGVFPEEEFSLFAVRRTENVGGGDKVLFEQLVSLRIDPVYAPILVVRQPNEEAVAETAVVAQRFQHLEKINRNVVQQKFLVGVAVAN